MQPTLRLWCSHRPRLGTYPAVRQVLTERPVVSAPYRAEGGSLAELGLAEPGGMRYQAPASGMLPLAAHSARASASPFTGSNWNRFICLRT